MKIPHISNHTRIALTAAVIGLGSILPAKSQTIEWGSVAFNSFQQSNGDPLDSSFIIELGTFDNLFTPTNSNVVDWLVNWEVFDTATFSTVTSSFSSTADMNSAGGSEAPTGNANFDFEGMQAYIWIRNEDAPSPTAEWYLADDPSWVYPTALDDCCNNQPPLQWVIANQVITVKAIPEPSTGLLTILAASAALLRRRRA